MRRLVLAAALASASVTATALAMSSSAGPAVPLNHQTEAFAIHQSFDSVVVNSDYGSITVKPGDSTKVTATEAWNLYAPTVTAVVRNGVLRVDATCTKNVSVANTVTVEGLTDTANQCTDDLALVVPSSIALTATAYTGTVTTDNIDGVQKLIGTFGVTITDAGSAVEAQGDNGSVAVRRMHGSSLRLTSSTGNVTASDVSASTISMSTSNGESQLTRANSHAITLSSDTTTVLARDVVADSLRATSSNGQVQIDHSRILAITAHSDSSSVTVNDVTAPSITATSSNGVVSVEQVVSDAIVASSDSADVQVSTLDRPDVIDSRSSNGAVFVDVPRGSYAITATTSNGTVTITGVKNQPHAKHRIIAQSDSNNVTINGH